MATTHTATISAAILFCLAIISLKLNDFAATRRFCACAEFLLAIFLFLSTKNPRRASAGRGFLRFLRCYFVVIPSTTLPISSTSVASSGRFSCFLALQVIITMMLLSFSSPGMKVLKKRLYMPLYESFCSSP